MKTITKDMMAFNKNSIDIKLLSNNYYKALKNPFLKEIVDQINLEDKELMKYTSMLEEASIEYENCSKCKNILECKNKVTGYAFLPITKYKKLEFGYNACRYQKKLIEDNKHYKYISLIEVPNELKNASMKDVYTNDEKRFETIAWLNKFILDYPKGTLKKGLYLSGSFGCGKTYLIAATFNELAKQKVKSAIVYWPEFLRDLKTSFTTDEFKEKFDKIKKVELLLIDDIGAESVTEWNRDEILGSILQYRMQMQLPTFFTSNMDIVLLENHLASTKDKVSTLKAKRIIERIKQLTIEQEMIAKNYR